MPDAAKPVTPLPPEPLSCPFCGSPAESYADTQPDQDWWGCSNSKCDAYTIVADREQWNRRAPRPAAPPTPTLSPDAIAAVKIVPLTEHEAVEAAAVFAVLVQREDPYALTRTVEHVLRMRAQASFPPPAGAPRPDFWIVLTPHLTRSVYIHEDEAQAVSRGWPGSRIVPVFKAAPPAGAESGAAPDEVDEALDWLARSSSHPHDDEIQARVKIIRTALARALVNRAFEEAIVEVARIEWCRDCDGCGWTEGGKTLQTTCHECSGTGHATSCQCGEESCTTRPYIPPRAAGVPKEEAK